MKHQYIKYLKYNKILSDNTIKSYIFYTNYLIKSKLTINEFIIENKLTIHQLKLLKYALKHFNSFIGEYRYDVDQILLPKQYPKSPVYLDNKEIKLLLKSKICNRSIFNKRNETIIRLFIETGIRVSELISLKYTDVYLSHIIVKGKGNKERKVLITPSLRSMLLNMRKDNDHIFINKWNEPLSRKGIYNIVKNMSKKSKIEKNVSPHVLRHTNATLMLNNGMDIYSLSKLLGHSSISTTQIYLHFDKNVKNVHKKIIQKIQDV